MLYAIEITTPHRSVLFACGLPHYRPGKFLYHLCPGVTYYDLYADEINERIARNEYWTEERVWEKYPFTKPSWR